MPTYTVIAKVDQIVTKEVQALVEASSEEEAHTKMRDALQTYPAAILTEGVRGLVTTKSTYWIPKTIDITRTERVKEVHDKTN